MSLSRTGWSRPGSVRGTPVTEVRALSLAPSVQSAELNQDAWSDPERFDEWRIGLRREVLTYVTEFVADRCAADLDASGMTIAGDILVNFVAGGKCLRSSYMYLGWLAGGAPSSDEALYASASLELLHAFALLQDDVMDASSSRRGQDSAHVQFSRWHRQRKLSGPADRFGESAAILLGDLCLIWAEQMLRESGVEHRYSSRYGRVTHDACRAGHGPVRRLANACASAVDVRGVGGCAAQVRQLHRAPSAGNRCGDGRMQRSHRLRPGRYGEAVGGVSTPRRRTGSVRRRDGHRQAHRQDLSITRPPAWSSPRTTWPTHRLARSSRSRDTDDLDGSAVERWRNLMSRPVRCNGSKTPSAIASRRRSRSSMSWRSTNGADRTDEYGCRVHGACRIMLSHKGFR